MSRIPADKMEIQKQFALRELAKKPDASNGKIAAVVKKEFGYPISAARVGAIRASLKNDQKPGGRLAGRRGIAEHRAMRRGKKVEVSELQTPAEPSTGTNLVLREPEDLIEMDLPEDLRSLAVSFVDKLREQQFTKLIFNLTTDETTVKYERVVRGMTNLD